MGNQTTPKEPSRHTTLITLHQATFHYTTRNMTQKLI